MSTPLERVIFNFKGAQEQKQFITTPDIQLGTESADDQIRTHIKNVVSRVNDINPGRFKFVYVVLKWERHGETLFRTFLRTTKISQVIK